VRFDAREIPAEKFAEDEALMALQGSNPVEGVGAAGYQIQTARSCFVSATGA
jgi:hypothetical protein